MHDGNMRFVVELPHKWADGLERRAVASDVDLPPESLPQQRTRNGHQVRGAFRWRHMHRPATDNRGIGIEIGHSRKHQAVGRFCHLDRIVAWANIFAIDRKTAVVLDGPDGNEDDVFAYERLPNLSVREASKQT